MSIKFQMLFIAIENIISMSHIAELFYLPAFIYYTQSDII